MIRIVRWIVAVWATVWLFRMARANRELMRANLERIDELGRRAAGYPNEWGVRTTPLTPRETRLAIQEEEALARKVQAADRISPDGFPPQDPWLTERLA